MSETSDNERTSVLPEGRIVKLFNRLFKRNETTIQQAEEDFSDYETTANTYLADLGLSWDNLRRKKILDIGAGSAGFAKAAKERGIEVVSLDPNPEYKLFEDVPYVQGNSDSLPFAPGIFDLVLARASTPIDFDKEKLGLIVSEAKRVLKEGGNFRFGPGLILPHINSEDELGFEEEFDRRNNLSHIDTYAAQSLELMKTVDPDVSLQRGEGFRLPVADYYFISRKV